MSRTLPGMNAGTLETFFICLTALVTVVLPRQWEPIRPTAKVLRTLCPFCPVDVVLCIGWFFKFGMLSAIDRWFPSLPAAIVEYPMLIDPKELHFGCSSGSNSCMNTSSSSSPSLNTETWHGVLFVGLASLFFSLTAFENVSLSSSHPTGLTRGP